MVERLWLKTIRISNDKTQCDVAKLSGISRSYYTNIELGLKTPTVEVAKKIAKTLNFEWTCFFSDKRSLKERSKIA